jgi:probable F420-dependent oxidoreductase
MKHAIYMPPGDDFSDPRTLAELAKDAEQAGWDGFFIWDHMILPGSDRMLDPWVGLAAVALSTGRMRIGTMVTPIPRRRPWKLAREVATLDRLSNGRVTLGVGIGLGHEEWDDFGEETSQKVRGEMLDEALEVLRGLWSGEPFSFEGKHYRVPTVCFRPTPVQPEIPIWVGGFWPSKPPMRRAARWDGVYPLFSEWEPGRKLELFKEALAYTRQQRQASDPFDVMAIGVTRSIADTEHPCAYEQAGATWWMEALDPWSWGWNEKGAWPIEAMRQRVRLGPAKTGS